MTTITIYPLFSNQVIISNIGKYAVDNGLTITSQIQLSNNPDGTSYAQIFVTQILSSAQKTAITTIFQGTAYITFT